MIYNILKSLGYTGLLLVGIGTLIFSITVHGSIDQTEQYEKVYYEFDQEAYKSL